MPEPGTSTAATTGTLELSRSPAAEAPSELRATGVAAPAEASTGWPGNWLTAPEGV